MPCSQHQDSILNSNLLEDLTIFINNHGFNLKPYCSGNLPSDIRGRIFYDKDTPPKTIYINEPCYFCAIMTIFHEIGHMLHFLKNGEQPSKLTREKNAFRLGWGLVCQMHLHKTITYKGWKEFHQS